MLKDLTRLLEKSYLKVRDEEIISLTEKIDELQKENAELKEQFETCEYTKDTYKIRLNTALDEIIQNQKRIDSLLRQLREKNGGK